MRESALTAPRPARGLGLQPFGMRGYPALWSANVAWNVGRWMEQIAVGWLALQLTDSAFLVALIGVYRSLPLFLLGIFGGVLGDRYDRRRLVLGLQVLNVLTVVALAALSLAGSLTYTHLAAAELILGTSMAFDWPSRRSLTADLVGSENLPNAVALDASAQNLSRVLGPLASGGIIAALSPGMALVILAVLYLLNLVLIWRLPRINPVGARRYVGGAWSSLRSGIGAVLQDQAIVGVLLITVWMNFFFFPYQQLLPVVAVDVLGTGSMGLGVLSAADGLGSLIGTLILGALVGHERHGLYFWLAALSASVVLILFSQARTLLVAVILQILGGLARAGFSVYQSAIVLRQCSPALRSRGMGVLTLAIGVGPFGQLEMGSFAQALGAPIAIGVNAALCAVLTATVVARMRGLREA